MISDVRTGVSRETNDRLECFAELVAKWTRKIGLVSARDAADIRRRHIDDSIQLSRWIRSGRQRWLDLGSGAGLPALVVAIMAKELGANLDMTLVECDQRKAVFLRTAIRELDIKAKVVVGRVEDLPPWRADILSARAFAGLEKLVACAHRHLRPNGLAIFPKGERWRNELGQARKNWSFALEAVPSRTNASAAILLIEDIRHV